jgi:D-sedoheptulose 7-phosphate isomerase
MALTNITFAERFLAETVSVLNEMDADQIEAVARGLSMVRDQGGRLFILSGSGAAGHARQTVDDFRKVCNFEAYAPTETMSEVAAQINDGQINAGRHTSLSTWLIGSRLEARDAILVFSVGGGHPDRDASVNLVSAIDLCRRIGASVFGIVGSDGGYTVQAADACVVIPPVYSARITPHTEGLCAVVCHLLVNHPVMHRNATHWQPMATLRS